ncbi:TPA: hypothetical protein ACRZSU_001819 [Campylobacter jejuni]
MFFEFWSASAYEGENVKKDFFAIVSYDYMVSIFATVSFLVLLALVGSVAKFYHAIEIKNLNLAVFVKSLKDALSLKYLGRHKNEGCTYPNEKRSNIRKIFHHFTAYGFLFCFIATSLGAFYHHFLNLLALMILPNFLKFWKLRRDYALHRNFGTFCFKKRSG